MSIKSYSEYTDFELANAYFNRIQYMTDAADSFWNEVNNRKGNMTPIEWLNYNY